MIISIVMAGALQVTPPPPAWSAECLSQISVSAGAEVRFYDQEWLSLVRGRANTLWDTAHVFLESHREASESAEQVSVALWAQEMAGEIPAGATEIDAVSRDRDIIGLASRYNQLLRPLSACELPPIEIETMEERRSARTRRLAEAGQ